MLEYKIISKDVTPYYYLFTIEVNKHLKEIKGLIKVSSKDNLKKENQYFIDNLKLYLTISTNYSNSISFIEKLLKDKIVIEDTTIETYSIESFDARPIVVDSPVVFPTTQETSSDKTVVDTTGIVVDLGTETTLTTSTAKWFDGVELPDIDLGNQGDYFLHTTSGDIFKKVLDDQWERRGNLKGRQGINGPRGKEGPKGDVGPKGDIGPQGIQGVQGPEGPMGLRGPKGDTGEQGPRGLQGVQGIQGPRGYAGVVISDTEPTDNTINVWLKSDGKENYLLFIRDDKGVFNPITSLKGDKGDKGDIGSYIFDGVGEPSINLGKKGDLYIQLGSTGTEDASEGVGDIYRKLSDDYWERIGNLNASQGECKYLKNVETSEDRDSINTSTLYNGTLCYVREEDTFYKLLDGEWGIANLGGGGGGTIGADTFKVDVSNSVDLAYGDDLKVKYTFYSSVAGKGTLHVSVGGSEIISTVISQGKGEVTITSSNFKAGANRVTMYVSNKEGTNSSMVEFTVNCTALTVSSNFDDSVYYLTSNAISIYYTPYSPTGATDIMAYLSIDGAIVTSTPCTNSIRSSFTVPKLSSGAHTLSIWIESQGKKSATLDYDLLLVSGNEIVATSSVKGLVTSEEYDQITLDYRAVCQVTSKFTVEFFIDNISQGTGTCSSSGAAWNISSLKIGNHVLKVIISSEKATSSATLTWNISIIESTFNMVESVKQGLLGEWTAKDKSNAADKNTAWIGYDKDGNEVEAELHNFAFSDTSSGWKDNHLICTGQSYVKIPLKPLANQGTSKSSQSLTVEVNFKSKSIGIEDACVISCYDNNTNTGFKINTQYAIIQSAEGNNISLEYTENKDTQIVFEIDRNTITPVVKVFINGIMTRSYILSDDGTSVDRKYESFYVDDYIYLNCQNIDGVPTNFGYCEIDSVRVYQIELTDDEVVNNQISTFLNKRTQQELQAFQNGATLPIMTITGSLDGISKSDKRKCRVVWNSPDPTRWGTSFTLGTDYTGNSTIQYKGTSSLQYAIKNYKVKLVDDDGKKFKYDPFGSGIAESTFTLEAD